jgi:hypothetical protein
MPHVKFSFPIRQRPERAIVMETALFVPRTFNTNLYPPPPNLPLEGEEFVRLSGHAPRVQFRLSRPPNRF